MMMISFYWQFCPTSFIVYVINFKIYCTYLVFGWWNGVCVMWSSCGSQRTTHDSHFSTFSLHLLWDEQPPWPYLLPWSTPQGWVNIFSELSEYLPRAEWDPSQGWVVYAYCFVKFYCNTANMFICLSAASSVLLRVFISVMKHHDDKQPGEERVWFIYTSIWLFIIKCSSSTKAKEAIPTRQKPCVKSWCRHHGTGLFGMTSSQDHQHHHTQWVEHSHSNH